MLAGGVTILNPKNLIILIGAGAVAGKQGLSTVELVLALVIFTVIATSPYLVMTGYVLLGGPRAHEAVQRWKDALLRNNHLIMAIVLGVLGLVLAIQGATSLSAGCSEPRWVPTPRRSDRPGSLSRHHPLGSARRQVVTLAHAVESTDPAQVGRALSALASSRRILAPLGWALGTILLLFQGLRTIVVNWRLTLMEHVPAIWIGLTWWDLRVHALHKLELTEVPGAILVVVAIGVIGITVACYWCNAVFAMAVEPGHPDQSARHSEAPEGMPGTSTPGASASGSPMPSSRHW